MHRSILTGLFVLALSAGAAGVAAADEAPPVSGTPAIAAQPAASDSVPAMAADSMPATAATDTAAVTAAGGDAAAPTAGADLAMWNVHAVDTPPAAQAPGRALSPLRRFASGIMRRSSAIASSLTRSAMRFIGVPYVFGGTRTTGFDCSGYVQHVFGMHGVRLPRTADAQFDAAQHVIAARIVPGDLVFFHTYAPGVSHVGIYIGNNKFIHASSSRGVSISNLHDRYWAPRYLGAKRVVGT